MAEVVPILDPTNYRRVHTRIKALLETGDTRFRGHGLERMQERGIDVTDVEYVLKFGRIVDHSCPSDRWRYVLEGKTVEGKKLRIVVEIDGMVDIVTAMKRS
jgi:hypothetical protein